MSEGTKPDLKDLPNKIKADKSFSVLEGYITEKTMKGIQEMGLTTMTDIQAKCIPQVLFGHDIFARAKTGSGKTLAFLIPVVDMIHQIGFKARNGTGAMIISPTVDLAVQTFNVLKELTKHHSHTVALLVGGNVRNDEDRRLFNGANVVVATPSRLLDHLTETEGFVFKNLELMVIDEADRMLQEGFEEVMKKIMEIVPATKQTLLFTATRSDETDAMAMKMFKGDPVIIDICDSKKATVEGLEQGYLICPPEKRFSALFTLMKEKMENSKIMVFMGSRDTVQFYDRIFRHWDLKTLAMHGGNDQYERARILRKFRKMKTGVLLCTDVAARGLDIKDVSWIIQFDPPTSVQEYIHRVGRTARLGRRGSALIFFHEHEVDFVEHLEKAKVPLDEFEMDWSLVPDLNVHLKELIVSNEFVRPWAMQGYEGYVRNYKSHPISDVFEFGKLDLNNLAQSFGFCKAPWIDFSRKRKAGERGKDDSKRKRISDVADRKFSGKKKNGFNK